MNEVIAMIAALPDVEALTIEDAAAVEESEAAYNALSDEQKAKVTNAEKLEQAIAKIAKEVKAAADAASTAETAARSAAEAIAARDRAEKAAQKAEEILRNAQVEAE